MLSRHIRFQAIIGLIAVLATCAMPANASSPKVFVTLDGRPSTVAAATQFHCHDLDRSALRCFRSESERDRVVNDLLGLTAGGGAVPAGATSTGYVIAFAAITYAGNSVVLSQNYPNLGTIGWDNIISSYKVYTNLTGAFYQNANYGGLTQQYCCFVNHPYVGDAYNDIFSSFAVP